MPGHEKGTEQIVSKVDASVNTDALDATRCIAPQKRISVPTVAVPCDAIEGDQETIKSSKGGERSTFASIRLFIEDLYSNFCDEYKNRMVSKGAGSMPFPSEFSEIAMEDLQVPSGKILHIPL